MAPEAKMLDVAVIGAGPAGLSAAVALLRCRSPTLSVEVFDHIPDFRLCGAGVGMKVNGYAAVDAFDSKLCQALLSKALSLPTVVSHTLDGKETDRSTTQDMGKSKSGLATVSMGWSELRNTFAEHLPTKAIHLSKRFLRLEQLDDHVRLHFTDGTSVHAKIVIGADGTFSKIRQQAVGDGLAEFTNTIIWRARLPIQTLPKDESHVFFGGNMTALYYPISQDTLVWTVTASAARLQEVGLEFKLHSSGSQKTEDKLPVESASSHHQQLSHQLSASERCKRVWGDSAKIIPELIDMTDESTVLEHNLHVRPPESLGKGCWGKGRVTLAGDAAHPLRPASGQGVAQAFEDAAHLAHAIQEGGLTEQSLRAFEAKRISRLQQIMAAEMAMGQRRYVSPDEGIPANLASYKLATEVWHGNAAAYDDWVQAETFEPLSSLAHAAPEQ